jgi:Na+/proline symporter
VTTGRLDRRTRSQARSRARSSAYCRRWLRAYWAAGALNLLFLVLALTGGDVPARAYFALIVGAVASALGAAMATHLVRRGIGPRDFDEATSSMRIVVVGWCLLVAAMLVGTVLGSGFGDRSSAGDEATGAVLDISASIAPELFSVAALFVVVGDGYTKYRRLLAPRREP